MTLTHPIGPVPSSASADPDMLPGSATAVSQMSPDCAGHDLEGDLPDLPHPTVAAVPRKGALRRTLERGQATAEYVVGILAAVAMALVLLKIFTGNQFFNEMLKFVVGLITKAGAMLP